MARIGRIGAGFGLIIAGVFMLVLPGPGIVTIAGGLALLSKDLEWAGRLADWTKSRFSSFFNKETNETDTI
jgi:uncharacterized protein (TIGR02611 family)